MVNLWIILGKSLSYFASSDPSGVQLSGEWAVVCIYDRPLRALGVQAVSGIVSSEDEQQDGRRRRKVQQEEKI